MEDFRGIPSWVCFREDYSWLMPTFSLLVDLQLGHTEGTEICPPRPAE